MPINKESNDLILLSISLPVMIYEVTLWGQRYDPVRPVHPLHLVPGVGQGLGLGGAGCPALQPDGVTNHGIVRVNEGETTPHFWFVYTRT